MSQSVPFFVSDHSIGESILSVEDESEICASESVSIPAISDTYELPTTVVVERGLSSYWKLYQAFASREKRQLIFGVKINVCAKLPIPEVSEEEVPGTTTSSVILFLKNSQAYFDMVRLYSEASVRHKTKTPILDWAMLQELLTENIQVVIPFYSGFIARNLLTLNCAVLPDFGRIRPIFCLENHGLAFDPLIRAAVTDYCAAERFETMESHHVYYYRKEDMQAHQVFLCMANRSILPKPNLSHYCSNEFSFEQWLENNGQSIR